MKHWMVLTVVTALTAAGTVPAVPAEQTATVDKAAPLQLYEAQCVVKISWNPEMMALSPEVVHALLNSSNISRRAMRDVLGTTADAKQGSIEVGFEPLGELPGGGFGGQRGRSVRPRGDRPGKLVGRLEVRIVDGRRPQASQPAAERVMTAVCARLRETLNDFGKSDLEEAQDRQHDANVDLELASAQLEDVRKRRQALLQDAGQSDLSRDRIVSEIESLTAQREDLALELAGQRARREALEARIARIGERVEARRSDGNAVAEQLEKIVRIRAEKFNSLKALSRSDKARMADVLEAEAALAEARVELARQRDDMAHEADERLAGLNDDLDALSVDNAEAEAKLQHIEGRLARITEKKLLALADTYESLELELDLARKAVEEATVHRNELARASRTLRLPSVTVLGEQ